jgi:hypothetical protein
MLNFLLIKIRHFIILLVLSILLPAVSSAQNTGAVAKWLETYRLSGDFQPVQLFDKVQDRSDLKAVVDHASILSLDRNQLKQLLETAPLTLQFQIPTSSGETYTLELAQVDILAPEFSFGTLGENARDQVSVSRGLHYRGIMQGDDYSMASLSIFSDGLVAMATDDNGTYQLGRMEDGSENYVFYKTADLHAAAPYSCFTDDDVESIESPEGVGDRGVGCKTVQIYFECDYKLYQDKGSNVSNVNNYVTALFNQVATLYANENISVTISQIYVWTTPDPYISQNSTSGVLNAFRTTRGTNFTGNLAHFLSTRSLGGGIAYVDVICVKEYAFGVSAIYNSYQNVPTYSWTVEVVTHELGHNLGSWHTHSCSWPGGALDNCVSPEGSCPPGPPPVNGGTIMSYCHLTSYGINFNNGFGPVPGNWIRSKVLAANCLSQSGTAPTGLTTTNITNTSAQLNWGAVTGTTSYSVQYKLSTASTWTSAGSTSGTTMTISGLSTNTAYNWQVKTDCSNYSATANFTTGNSGGTCNAPANLGSSSITSSSALVFWGAVSGATNYTVQYKISSSSTWMTAGTTAASNYTLTGLTASTTYNWKVKANCSAYSVVMAFTTSTSGGGTCDAPTNLGSGSFTSSSANVSWGIVSGASNYTVQYKVSSSSTWVTAGTTTATNYTLTGLTASTTYNWQVKANCSVYSAIMSFTTSASGGGGTCDAPAMLYNNSVTATTAVISWSASSGASNYTLQLRYASNNNYFTLGTVTGTQVTLIGLQPNMAYYWRVKANCSDYSNPLLLTTPASLEAPPTGEFEQPVLIFNNLSVYPNPVSQWLNLQTSGTIAPGARVWINDVTGRRWLDVEFAGSIDVANLPNGVYVLVLMNGEEKVGVSRFVKVE